ncbi:FFLEELY motif protein [Candidatus Contendibacter odensensis]|uniref:DUF8198 domain-containing protein n=1 Tax=Candidatus Contendobacter odensis Run_B_J11 TaxID=1400861 RepID=A0A7U7J511_9GAMM|nr:hypothetical protein [Candidatus Contendobacter odensis]CDH45870.1 conserved hypothetical protein [Candidatus Contendobacter odensis Run_B_J11]
MTDHDKTHNAARLLEQLQRNQAFRSSETGGLERELSLLRRWQSARLARTYADLRQNARYRLAAEFFLHELYGDGDLGQREQDLARIVPMMTHILPGNVLYTTALALELNALSRELDARLTRILVAEFDFRDSLDEATYVAAYRQCARYQQRSDQIELVEQLGRDLQSIVPRRFIHTALKLAKTPARLAGLVELHRFLSAGFEAFRCMGADAETFITTITRRERAILERIRSGHSQPLEWNGVSTYPGSTC